MTDPSAASLHARARTAHRLAGIAGSIVFLALATLAGLLIAPRWGVASVALLYLPPVLLAAYYAGFWPAFAMAAVSTLAYNYFFTEPYHSLMVHSPADVLTIAMLLVVGTVTSRLAGSLRDQARLAGEHAARNATIAGFARQLLVSPPHEEAIAAVAAGELHWLFGCRAVVLSGADAPHVVAEAPHGSASLAPSDIAAATQAITSGEAAGRHTQQAKIADWQFLPVRAADATIAVAGLARSDGALPVAPDQQQLLANLLDQLALALERARLEHEAREVAALRERDRLRAVLLAAIGEQVRPRLTAIGTAARGLRRSGADRTLAATVATETAHLDRYIDELVGLEPGTDQTPLAFGAIEIDLYRRTVARAGTPVRLTPKEFEVLAELARNAGRVLSHGHLLRSVWGPARADHIDYLRVAISSLRKKLESDPAHPALIVNEPAVGYRLAVP